MPGANFDVKIFSFFPLTDVEIQKYYQNEPRFNDAYSRNAKLLPEPQVLAYR